MTAWSDLTPVQADAVRAAAAAHLRDPEDLLADLGPLLTAASTAIFTDNVVAPLEDPPYVLGDAADIGFTVRFAPVPPVPSTVNNALTPGGLL